MNKNRLHHFLLKIVDHLVNYDICISAVKIEPNRKNMKATKLPIEFAPEFGFDVPAQFEPLSRKNLRALERLKQSLLNEHLAAEADERLHSSLRYAAHEAASLAWATPYPLLVLPALMEEKRQEARQQAERQQSIRARSETLFSMAA